ncbi:MAG: HlyD family secretion protein [Saprospiraceae bacterium]
MIKSSVGLFLLIAIVASVFVPVELPYAFDSTAKVYPLQKWVLQKSPDGSLISSLHNYKTGLMKDYASYQFDRGDVVNIKFNENQILGTKVDSGTLIANITSNSLQEDIVQLKNRIAIERANLTKELAGQKPETIRKGEEEVILAKQQLDLERKYFDRAEQMFKEGLISRAEFEDKENNFKGAQIRVELAQKNITVLDTGEKPEQISLIRTRINALDKEIAFLQNTSNNYTITSPIGGKVRFETDLQGDRLIIEDSTEHILFIPVKLEDRDFVGLDSKVELKVLGSDSIVLAQLIEVSNKVEVIYNNLVVLAKASVKGSAGLLSTGMPIRCKVTCGSVTPKEYLKRAINVDLK